MTRLDLIEKIIRTVPMPRLIMAIGAILARRKREAERLPEDARVELEVDVTAFLSTCSKRQLRMLREIALGLEIKSEGRVH